LFDAYAIHKQQRTISVNISETGLKIAKINDISYYSFDENVIADLYLKHVASSKQAASCCSIMSDRLLAEAAAAAAADLRSRFYDETSRSMQST